MTRERLSVLLASALLAALGAPASPAEAQAEFDLDGAGNCFIVGMVQSNAEGYGPFMCWRDQNGEEQLVGIRSDGGAGSELDQDVWIDGSDGNDSGSLVPFDDWGGPSQCDCADDVTGNWDKLVFDGHYVVLYGNGGDDALQCGPDSETCGALGAAGDDILYNYSTVGYLDGGGDDDQLVDDSGGSVNTLWGQEGNDCLMDIDGTFQDCDCGDSIGNGDLRYSQHFCDSCESTTSCCGLEC
jgi:hypothetical protein